MNDIFFLRPYFLYLCFPFAILFVIFLTRAIKKSPWQKICSKDLAPHVLDLTNKQNILSFLLIPFTCLLLIIGLSGPSWSKIETPIFKEQSGLVLVLDLSDIMNAEDLKPSRLKRAVYKINDLLNGLKTKQAALIVFSEKPFVVTPLTDDIANIKTHLSSLNTHIMPSKGHRVDLAVQKASELLTQGGVVNGSVLLITPEISEQEMSKTLDIVKASGIKLSILGAAEEGKVAIPKEEGGFMKDQDGSLMMTEFSEKKLMELAALSRGVYAKLSMDDRDIQALERGILGTHFDTVLDVGSDQKQEFLSKWQDQGYLFVLLAMPFVLLIFRPGFFLSALATMFFFMPISVYADYFQSSDKKGETLFHLEEYRDAKELFENQSWKACAHYKLNEYEEAADLFKEDKTANGLYNYGTSKAKLNDFEEALKAYQDALEIDPDHEDAQHNKGVIEEFLKQQPQEEQKKEKEKNKTDKKQDTKNESQNQKEKESQNKENEQNDEEKEESEKTGEEGDNGEESDSDKAEDPEKVDEDEQKKLNEQYRDSLEDENPDAKEEEEEGVKQEGIEEKEPVDRTEDDRQNEIDERLLRRVKDDPSELLRRKFLRQYRQQR